MSEVRSNGTWVIVASLFAALIFSTMPLPHMIEWGRPEWVALVLIYWVIALPYRVGVSTAWVVGLLMDVLNGTMLGQHALSLSIIVYFTFMLHLRVRVFPLWQQCLTVFVLIGVRRASRVVRRRGGVGQDGFRDFGGSRIRPGTGLF